MKNVTQRDLFYEVSSGSKFSQDAFVACDGNKLSECFDNFSLQGPPQIHHSRLTFVTWQQVKVEPVLSAGVPCWHQQMGSSACAKKIRLSHLSLCVIEPPLGLTPVIEGDHAFVCKKRHTMCNSKSLTIGYGSITMATVVHVIQIKKKENLLLKKKKEKKR